MNIIKSTILIQSLSDYQILILSCLFPFIFFLLSFIFFLGLSKLIMFLNGFVYLPCAFQSFRKDDEVSFAEVNRFAVFRRHHNIALEDIAGFFLIIFPGEFRFFLCPYRPGTDSQPVQFFLIRFFDMYHFTLDLVTSKNIKTI